MEELKKSWIIYAPFKEHYFVLIVAFRQKELLVLWSGINPTKELSDSEFAQEFLDLANDLDLYNEFIIREVNDILREVVKDLQNKVVEGEAKIDAINRYRKGQIAQQRFVTGKKLYPNDPCYCGSGKKFKKCCGKKI